MLPDNSTPISVQELFRKVRESHIRAGAHRLQQLLGSHFHDLSSLPTILVTGTNGKGTTCAFLESILRHSGFKTGLYTSPHLVSVTERVRIGGIPVLEKEILDTIQKLDTNRHLSLPDATFFELMTAAALHLFYEKNVDIVICEVGLGGRYDSTNVLNPMISVLTGVSLDHTHILGKNVAAIAQDKSYISRRNKPFVVHADVSQTAFDALSKTVEVIGSQVVLTSQKLSVHLEKIFSDFSSHKARVNLRTALTVIDCLQKTWLPRSSRGMTWESSRGMTQLQNRGLTPMSSRGLTAGAIRKGIKNTFWPGRFDVRKIENRTVIFDCAHNPGGVQFFLEQYAKSKFSSKQYDLIFTSLKDKDWQKNISLLAPLAKNIEVIQLENERAEDANSIFLYLKKYFPESNVSVESELNNSLHKLLKVSSNRPVLVIGSIAFVGAVFGSVNLHVFPS